jgi:hypothetical protein
LASDTQIKAALQNTIEELRAEKEQEVNDLNQQLFGKARTIDEQYRCLGRFFRQSAHLSIERSEAVQVRVSEGRLSEDDIEGSLYHALGYLAMQSGGEARWYTYYPTNLTMMFDSLGGDDHFCVTIANTEEVVQMEPLILASIQ